MGGRGGGRGQRGGSAGRGGGQARRVVAIVPPGPGANKQTPKKPATLDARFTQLAQRRAETGQRVATARYAATMAKRTGQSAKQFAVRRETREPPPTAPPHAVVASIHFIHSRAQPERVRTSRDSR